MKKLTLLLLLVTNILFHSVRAEMVIIVNEKNSIDNLSKSEVIDLYMGRHTQFSNGVTAVPIEQQKDSKAQKLFYKQLVGKSLAKINAYWARLRFTGRARPPKNLTDSKSVQQFVKNNSNAIAYLDNNNMDSTSLKVVYRFDPF